MKCMLTVSTAAVLAAAACSSPRRGPPLEPLVALDSAEERHGEVLFFRFCHPCHPFGEGGLGPSLNDKPLPDLAIRAQVRGGLGAMPGFDAHAIPDRELDAIVAYMDALRAGDPATRTAEAPPENDEAGAEAPASH